MCAVLELARPDLDGKHGSVLASMQGLERHRFSVRHALSDPGNRCRFQTGIEVAGMHSDHLLTGVAEAFTSLPIDVKKGLAFVEQVEAIGRMIDEAAKTSLARPQLVLGSL